MIFEPLNRSNSRIADLIEVESIHDIENKWFNHNRSFDEMGIGMNRRGDSIEIAKWPKIDSNRQLFSPLRIDILAGQLIKKKNSHETGLELTVFNSNTTILHRILIRIQWWYQNRLSSHIRQILKNAQIQGYHPQNIEKWQFQIPKSLFSGKKRPCEEYRTGLVQGIWISNVF